MVDDTKVTAVLFLQSVATCFDSPLLSLLQCSQSCTDRRYCTGRPGYALTSRLGPRDGPEIQSRDIITDYEITRRYRCATSLPPIRLFAVGCGRKSSTHTYGRVMCGSSISRGTRVRGLRGRAQDKKKLVMWHAAIDDAFFGV